MVNTVNKELFDNSVRHQVFLTRFGGSSADKVARLINSAEKDIEKRLRLRLQRLGPIAKQQVGRGRVTSQRLVTLLADLKQQRKDIKKAIRKSAKTDLLELANVEVDLTNRRLNEAFGVNLGNLRPSPELLNASVNGAAMRGQTLNQWFDKWEKDSFQRADAAIQLGIIEGDTTPQIIRRVQDANKVSRRSATTLVRTSTNHIASQARELTYEANSDIIKAVRWVSTLDSRTSPICIARDGLTFPIGEGPRPPAHPNCLPGDSLVLPSGKITAVSKRWFDGDLIIVHTAEGREFRSTPNHPVLASSGWIKAGRIKVGQKLFTDQGAKGLSPLINNKDNNIPTSIHDVSESFFSSSKVSTSEVPLATPDFHGDGADSEIAIIGTHNDLPFESHIPFNEKIGNHVLKVRRAGLMGLSSFGFFYQLNHTSGSTLTSNICPMGHGFSFGLSGLSIPFLVSKRGFFSFLRILKSNFRGLLSRSHDSSLFEPVIDGTFTDVQNFSDCLSRFTGKVHLDDVVRVEKVHFSGHVYNLQTENQFYSASGLIVHNCRSTTTPITKSWEELGRTDIKPGRGSKDFETAFEKNLKKQGFSNEKIATIKRSTRASLDGQVPDVLTYQQWIKRQPAGFQDEVMGKTKGALFRRGDLAADKFVDMRTGRPFTIDELKDKESQAFMKANLEKEDV